MPRKRRQTYKAKEQNTGKEQNTEENNEQDTISCSGTDTLTENTKDQDMGQIDDNASEVSNASLASGSKKQRANCSLSQSEEQNLVEWIKENEILWNRNKQGFRNKSVKETIWKDKATEMNKDVKYLMTWYESLRTRFGRLKKKAKGKSGDGKESVNRNKWTDREIWVYDNFVFLSDFVGEVLTRPLQPLCPPRDASPPSTVTTDVPADDDDEVQSIFMDSEGPHMDSGSQYSSSSMSTKGRGRSSRQIVADKMAEDRSRMLNIQEQMLTLIKPVPELSERQAFGEWITTSMRDVDQSLWRSFKMRIIGVVDEFLAASENIKKKRATPPQFQTPAAQKPLYSQAGTPLGTLQQASSSSYSWQPSSDTWQMYPNTQSNISWPQQNTSWVSSNVQQQQIEVTQLQPAAATSATQQSSTLHETSPIQSMYQDQALNTSQQQE